MRNFNDMINELKQDREVPKAVWSKYRQTLSQLPEQVDAGSKRSSWRLGSAIAAAVVLVVGSSFIYANPALAEKIPFIGGIFAEVEDLGTFSGDFSEKADQLAASDSKELAEGAAVAENTYTVSNAGVTFTAAEIYSDGFSVFITAKVVVEQGGLTNIPGYRSDPNTDMLAHSLYLKGDWNLVGQEDETKASINNPVLEGKVIDDHTFIGMMKFDLAGADVKEGEVSLRLSEVGYDDVTSSYEEDISAAHKIAGEWSLSLPFTTDQASKHEITVNKEANGYRLNSVFVSPYQIIATTSVPYTEREITRAGFEEVMQSKTGGTGDYGITYEEYVAQNSKEYAECYTIILNQDGKIVPSQEGTHERTIFAVQDMEVSKLSVYIFDNIEAYESILRAEEDGKSRMTLAEQQAVLSAEVEVQM